MKKSFKKFLLVLCVLTMSAALTACGGEDKSIQYDKAGVEQSVGMFVQQTLPQLSVDLVEAEELSMEEDMYEVYHAAAESVDSSRADLGEIESVVSITSESDEEDIIVRAQVVGTTGKTAEVEVILDKRMSLKSCAVNVNRTFGELMTNAALNTLLGMGTVFVVLIFISFIISLFKFVNEFDKKSKANKAAAKESPAAAAADKAVAQIIETEEQSDDLELIAVISAAIAAYEESQGNSGDGYVVRSIKRRCL